METARRRYPLGYDDPITKVEYVELTSESAKKYNICTICLRKSGQIDMYWNLKLVWASNIDQGVICPVRKVPTFFHYADIAMNF